MEQRKGGPARAVTFSDGGVSLSPIPARLLYQPVEGKTARLAWDVEVEEREHVWTVRVDAATGEVLLQWDQVVHDHWGAPTAGLAPVAADLAPVEAGAGWHPPMVMPEAVAATRAVRAGRSGTASSYRVFDSPVESPNYGERTLVDAPADPVASPNGWHDTGTMQYTKTRGNNSWAYIDASGVGGPNGPDAEPDGGEELIFDFPLDLTQQPSTYRPAAATNLFYWTNLIHDVLFHYGFDEVSGNFQETNFSGEGLGGDALRAEGQDGSDSNNARYFRSPDGATQGLMADMRLTLSQAREATADLADNMEALKRNFLFRGFFNDRGYFDLDDISPRQYREGVLEKFDVEMIGANPAAIAANRAPVCSTL